MEVTLELAKEALGQHTNLAHRQTTITDIIEAVTKYYDVRLSDLQSKKRNQSIAIPRQICMYLARSLTRHSLGEIGGHLGGRDHTTVIHAYSKIQQLLQNDPDTRLQIEELSRTIGS